MSHNIPAIAFSAWSGTGKTTIIEQLIRRFKQKNLRVAVIKHDAHEFEIDQEGKDSWRFTQAGADMTVLSSEQKTVLMEQRSLSLQDLLSMVHDVDLILLEGYNQEQVPGLYRVGISRRATGKGFRLPLDHYNVLVTDEAPDTTLPCFSPDEIDGLADFLLTDVKCYNEGH